MLSFTNVYRKLGTEAEASEIDKVTKRLPKDLDGIQIQMEFCFNVEYNEESKQCGDMEKMMWLITETFEPENISKECSFLPISNNSSEALVEVGPRLAFSTAWSSNSLSMLQACGVHCVTRMEQSRRYKITFTRSFDHSLRETHLKQITDVLYDRMTECVYPEPLRTFCTDLLPEPVQVIPVLTEGREALERINEVRGLGFDDWDLDFYTAAFRDQLRRDPTDVELFDIGQSNSEHSRHWFFGGAIHLDGILQSHTLFNMVKATLSPDSLTAANSVIAFHDNSSAIEGCAVDILVPEDPTRGSAMQLQRKLLHPILTAETHNFPTGVAPHAGAETGTGGRLRDVQATGRGAHTLAGICGYCVGALHIPHHSVPWESDTHSNSKSKWMCPANVASPLDILIEASNGASDYGNKYGEPVVAGFTRSFGQLVPKLVPTTNSTSNPPTVNTAVNRMEWLKPVMFTAGVGLLDEAHAVKGAPEEGMLVCKVGGPAYRIGMGGGAASSRTTTAATTSTTIATTTTSTATTDKHHNTDSTHEQDTQLDLLDFNAVQRGDAEMENRMNRVIRGCVELGPRNPIVSIHDQGAGGNGNVLKELVDPKGAHIDLAAIPSGDPTLSVLELWGAEYQENNAFLAHSTDSAPISSNTNVATIEVIQRIAQRENCTVSVVGVVTGDGRIVVDAPLSASTAARADITTDATATTTATTTTITPVNLPLSLVLGKMPQKHFHLVSPTPMTVHNTPVWNLPADVTVTDALHRVLQLVDVGSKRFLTNKVDRSVTGLVAQQQCVGPLHTPLADVAVLAQSHFATTGIATAVGEQPLKGLVDSTVQARMTVCEALSNLVFAPIGGFESIKASCNWMWPAKVHEKVEGEGSEGEIAEKINGSQGTTGEVNMEGARMYTACAALRDCLLQLGVGIDGGKDSLTMAAQVGENNTVVKCPGQVVLTCYALCTDITNVLTPDFKHPDRGLIVYVDLGEGCYRLAGTALSAVYQQAGRPFQPRKEKNGVGEGGEGENEFRTDHDEAGVPDLVCASRFLAAFHCIQHCLKQKYLQAGHDRSDGGIIVTLLEMAFAGNVGIEVTVQEAWNQKSVMQEGGQDAALLPILFAEECGYGLEVLPEHLELVLSVFREKGLSIECIGKVTSEKVIKVDYVYNSTSASDTCEDISSSSGNDSSGSSDNSNNNADDSSHGASADNTNISVADSNNISYISSSSSSNSYLTQRTTHTSDTSNLPSSVLLATSTEPAPVDVTTTANTTTTANVPSLATRTILHSSMTSLRDIWESTSFALELLQCQADCVTQERDGLKHRSGPPHVLTFTLMSSSMISDTNNYAGEKSEAVYEDTKGTKGTDSSAMQYRKDCTSAAYIATTATAPTLADYSSNNSSNSNRFSSIPRGPTQPREYLVAILRQEGTNGDREMHAAFYTAGFTPYDVNMNDLLNSGTTNNNTLLDLSHFRGIVFCGGFSYADVHGSAKGWTGVIKFNPRLMSMFTAFKEREDTFSLGVCNGCQLMALLGWVGRPVDSVGATTTSTTTATTTTGKQINMDKPSNKSIWTTSAIDTTTLTASTTHTATLTPSDTATNTDTYDEAQQTRFVHNHSRRFESRWSAVKVLPSPAVLLQGMEGSTLGVWVAHGEGRVYFPPQAAGTLQHTLDHHLAPLRFVDDANTVTEEYPFNPSGATHGIAGLCSEDGRHLALMPHPERSFLLWQIPYLPVGEKERLQGAPWLRLFQNAKTFCDSK